MVLYVYKLVFIKKVLIFFLTTVSIQTPTSDLFSISDSTVRIVRLQIPIHVI